MDIDSIKNQEKRELKKADLKKIPESIREIVREYEEKFEPMLQELHQFIGKHHKYAAIFARIEIRDVLAEEKDGVTGDGMCVHLVETAKNRFPVIRAINIVSRDRSERLAHLVLAQKAESEVPEFLRHLMEEE